MEKIIFLIVLCTAVEGDLDKHVFVPKSMTWLDAQAYCRQHYTDLSFVISQSDQDTLQAAVSGNNASGWIGLYRNPSNISAWKWSGGGYITYQNWLSGQPDSYGNLEFNAHIMPNGKWNDINGMTFLPFYCFNSSVVEVKKTWEKALKHCRKTHAKLISLLSETEHWLAQKAIQRVQITERVWFGLRYLSDRWLWVDKHPLVYQAWPRGGDQDHQCPAWKRCGALTKGGLWENRDCQERLHFICM